MVLAVDAAAGSWAGVGSVVQPEVQIAPVIDGEARATRSRLTLSTATAVLCAALILYARAYGLIVNPDPWLDEAMQMLNFLNEPWSDLFKPQPLFAQATSLGYLAIGILTADLAPEHLTGILRAVSAVASVGMAALLFLALRSTRSTLQAALVAAVAALGPTAIYQGVEIKAYSLEALCTAALLATALNAYLKGRSSAPLILFLAVALAGLIFANAALFPIAGSGAALFLFAAFERPLDARRMVLIAAVGGLIVAFAAALYFGYTAPSTAFQLEAYAEGRANGRVLAPLQDGWLMSWLRFLSLLERPYLPSGQLFLYLVLHGLTFLGLVTSLMSASRAERFIALGCTLTLAALALAAMAGLFTPYRVRHVLFTTPVTAFFLTTGLQRACLFAAMAAPAAMRLRLATAAAATLVLAYGAAMVWQADHTREPIRPALERLAAVPEWPQKTWVHHAAQPALDLQTWPQKKPYLGRVSHESNPSGWGGDARHRYEAHLARLGAEAKQRDELYILISHIYGAEAAQPVAIVRANLGPCRVVSAARGAKATTRLYHCERSPRRQQLGDDPSRDGQR